MGGATNVWRKAVDIFHGPSHDNSTAFIHRDYHPGNVLWQSGRITGLVDWASASIGSPSIDVGHCRGNLVRRFDLGVADSFTVIWEQLSGQRFDPWADVMTIIGFVDGLREDRYANRIAIEDALARAVADLGVGQV